MFGKKKSGVTEEAVMSALSTVIEPELHRDLVALNMIRDLQIKDNDVSFTIMLTTPACPLRGKMEADSRAALSKVDGIGAISIKWDANVPQDRRIGDQIGQNCRSIIAVSSGKGGVGKTTVSVNLAVSLAQQGARVGLLDADILGPNVPKMMGIEKMPPPRDRKLIPAERYGVKVISMAFLAKPDEPLVWRGPMLHSAIRQFFTDVAWEELDYLIVDLPPGTGDAQLTLAQIVPLTGAVIVTQPMEVAVMDALRGFKMFEKLNVPIIGVIENMSGEFFGSGAGEKLAQDYNLEFLGIIPLDAHVRVGGDSGQPVVVEHPESAAAYAFTAVTKQIAARVSLLNLASQPNFIPIQMIG